MQEEDNAIKSLDIADMAEYIYKLDSNRLEKLLSKFAVVAALCFPDETKRIAAKTFLEMNELDDDLKRKMLLRMCILAKGSIDQEYEKLITKKKDSSRE